MATETKNDTCSVREEHQGHLCELESQQEWDIIKQVTDQPTVRCENCGNVANSPRNVCMPTDL
ncbi:hypothetical protein F6V25_00045 [Oryzomonas japonica]|uniref:Uncharacterized protein n=1 Tax=Oryzomonas japonica TaxID=2603858 RepID=A0A7J4ZUK7_9BACT|nr:hypothetical protein [Oryzomonas japonica]KAB0667129.1 hypothetical protein F6V25_00045 [Oryzomonas japonica]